MSVLNVVLPLGSSVLSLVFAGMVFDQWWQRRHSFQLVWAIGLLWYGISAGTEFVGGAFGWSEPLYRTWYLIGAFFVAAYLGAGSIYLLSKSRFGYFAGVTVIIGGLLSLLFSHANAQGTNTPLYPGSGTAGTVAFVIAMVGGIAIIAATAVRRPLAAHIAMAVLVIGSIGAAWIVLGAALPAPGYALDPNTHVPVGSAFPGYVRVLTGPFNIAGALCLAFGAVYSAYVYMPKRKVLRAKVKMPVLAQLYGVAAIAVNLVASLPRGVTGAVPGQAQLARAGDDPDRDRGLHPRGDERPEPVRRHVVLLPGRVPGCAFHFRRVPGQRGGLSQRAAGEDPLVSPLTRRRGWLRSR